MPNFCMVVGCGNDSAKRKDISFFRVPKVIKHQGEQTEKLSEERRRLWITAISRADLTEKILENDRVCGEHFVSGVAAKSWDRYSRDWVPSLNIGHKKLIKDTEKFERNRNRHERVSKRRKREALRELEEASKAKDPKLEEESQPVRILFQQDFIKEEEGEELEDFPDLIENLSLTKDVATSTDEFDYMSDKPTTTKPFDEDYFCDDDDKVKFYTGLPSFEVLKTTFDFVAPHVKRRSLLLSKFQEFIMVLMKLHLNVPHQDLAYRFNVSRSLVSRAFSSWMLTMDIRLSTLIVWPSRENLHKTMPKCFLDAFGLKATVIIDCYEIFIDRPTNLLARAQTFSSYKHHNTVKVLIGITPQGTISFVSEAWGGRVSDKFLTENCSFLNNLLPGDLVLADRGFTIEEGVWYQQAQINVPAFTKGKDQLDPIDVEKTRNIANVRIHVERVIGVLRQKYTILQSTLPTDYLISSNQDGRETPLINRIIRVCSALVNLCPPIIPFD